MSLVSIIVPAYNQARYLGLAVQSVLNQTYPELEVIIVDDGSTDDTAVVARGFSDARVRYVHQANRGLSGARNTGLRQARGEFLTFLDSDDLFLPDKLARLVAEFERYPEAGLAAGQAVPVDQHGQRIGKIFDSRLPEDPAQLVLGNPLHVGSVMLRRFWQERVGFFDESLRSYEDWDMWLRLARVGCPMTSVAHPVSLYRFHTAQMTRDGRQMTTANFAVLEKVFGDPHLPEHWQRLRPLAYSNAYLRAAAHNYLVGDYANAKTNLAQAVELNNRLLADDMRPLTNHFSAWTELPKTGEPLAFLENIYHHLPENLAALKRRRRQDIGRVAMKIAFETHQSGDRRRTRAALWRALRYQPGWLAQRGVLSILVKSYMGSR